jgi:hypothetical protein
VIAKYFIPNRQWITYPEGVGGREVLDLKTKAGFREYVRRKLFMRERQNDLCSLCGEWMALDDCTFEHEDGKGHGGGHRDDRTEKPDVNGDIQDYNSAAHGHCNILKASVRLRNYQPEAA